MLMWESAELKVQSPPGSDTEYSKMMMSLQEEQHLEVNRKTAFIKVVIFAPRKCRFSVHFSLYLCKFSFIIQNKLSRNMEVRL